MIIKKTTPLHATGCQWYLVLAPYFLDKLALGMWCGHFHDSHHYFAVKVLIVILTEVHLGATSIKSFSGLISRLAYIINIFTRFQLCLFHRLNSELEIEYKKKSKHHEITDALGRVYWVDFSAMKEFPLNRHDGLLGHGIKIRRYDRTKGEANILPTDLC